MKSPRIATIGRSVKEWIGKDNDDRPPKHVLLRILRRHNHRCHISGREITDGTPWEAEHIKPLWAGGENREANYAPALVDPHSVMTDPEQARSDYVEHCGGCHGLRGDTVPAHLPELEGRVGWFMCTPEARAYLIRLPNVAHSRIKDNAELADMMNYVVFVLGEGTAPAGTRPFTADEVAREPFLKHPNYSKTSSTTNSNNLNPIGRTVRRKVAPTMTRCWHTSAHSCDWEVSSPCAEPPRTTMTMVPPSRTQRIPK